VTAVLHAEWTKFRTVAGWVSTTIAAGLMVVLVALLAGISSDQKGSPPVPAGPGGGPVTDSFYFVHRPLSGDGSITVSVSALTSRLPAGLADLRPGVVPWAKAGLIIKQSTVQGSPYAAVMVTGTHGVRMQHDFVHDTAGPAISAGWLRLVRAGDTVTGYASTDGAHWTTVDSVRLDPGHAEAGLFVASPPAVDGQGTTGSVSTAVFGNVQATGTGEQVGAESPTFAGYPGATSGSFTSSGESVTVTGAGDIAPAVRESLPTGGTQSDLLTGTFAALIAVIVVGALSITTEYRKDLIRVTLAAVPRRAPVLPAKAAVLGCVTFAAGLAGTLVALPLGTRLSRASGVYVFPVTSATGWRVALGTAALLAIASILALAVGAIVRSSAGAVTTVVLAMVLPYLLVANPFMPAAVADWLTRVTPAAAFAVQQTLVRYPQVATLYKPYDGYYPLAPWAGLAVLAGYAVAALVVATVVLRRRDA
jgi:hypothetical protein